MSIENPTLFAITMLQDYKGDLARRDFPDNDEGDHQQWVNESKRASVDAAIVGLRAAPSPAQQATDGGRNPRYEGLFEGETEEQRASRLAASPSAPAADADPCPKCIPDTVCRTPKCGRLQAQQHQPIGIDSEGGSHD